MKDFSVTAPDGQVYRVQAPETATDSELVQLAQQQAREASRAGRPKMTAEERMLVSPVGRIAKGIKDPIDAGAQMLPRGLSALTSAFGLMPNRVSQWLDNEAAGVDQGIADSEVDYQGARWKAGQEGFDGARLVGNVVSPVNIGLGRLLPIRATGAMGRAVQGAGVGAVGGSFAPVTEVGPDSSFVTQKAGQVLAGAAGGAVASPLLGKIADVAAPRVKGILSRLEDPAVSGARASLQTDVAIQRAITDAGLDGADIPAPLMAAIRQQVLDANKQGLKFDPAALLRKADFDAQGVPYLSGQVTRDPAQFSRQMNLRGVEGVGEPIQQVLNAQNQRITADLARFGGPRAAERYQAGEQTVRALKTLDDRMRSEVTRAYQNARASSGKDWNLPMQGLAQDVAQVLDDFGTGLGENNNVPGAIVRNLKSYGVIADDAMTQRKVFTYEAADKLLKQINAHDNGQNASLAPLREAVKRAITEGGGDGDPFAAARKLAASRFQLLDALPALDAVASAKTPQEVARLADDFVQKHIVTARVADVKKLAEVLPDEAKNEARRQIARVVYEGAFRNNATGDKGVQAAGLQSALKQIGPEKLRIFFSPQEIEELNRLTRIAAYANTEPAWGTVARGGNPGGVLFGGLARLAGAGGAASTALPVIGAMRNTRDVARALDGSVPKTANLTPEEVAAVSRALGFAGAGVGGLLAPRP